MNIGERKEKILELLNKHGEVKVSDLSRDFGISSITIRSDLADLEDKGILFRTHGGAVNSYKSYCDMDLQQRLGTNYKAKQLIAKHAINTLKDHDTVMFNSGTTTLSVFRAIPPHLHLNIVTNSITIALEASGNPNYNVVLLGGLVNAKYQFVYGDDAINQLKNYHADKLFLSVDGISAHSGLTTYYDREAEVARLMLAQSNTKIIVADSSKIGRTAFVNIVNDASDCLFITDHNDSTKEDLAALKKSVGKIITVKE
jgi:DeoR/GlpR family transcriptional regulator of sugar metabolism